MSMKELAKKYSGDAKKSSLLIAVVEQDKEKLKRMASKAGTTAKNLASDIFSEALTQFEEAFGSHEKKPERGGDSDVEKREE